MLERRPQRAHLLQCDGQDHGLRFAQRCRHSAVRRRRVSRRRSCLLSRRPFRIAFALTLGSGDYLIRLNAA
jgi:hypothetical protein